MCILQWSHLSGRIREVFGVGGCETLTGKERLSLISHSFHVFIYN